MDIPVITPRIFVGGEMRWVLRNLLDESMVSQPGGGGERGWKIQEFPPRYLPATDIVSSKKKKGPISQWTYYSFFWGGWWCWWGFLEFIFPERNQCGEVHLTKKIEESLYGTWKIWNHCPELRHCFRPPSRGSADTLLSRDTIDKPRSMITMSFMSFMFHDVLEMTRAMCQKKQEHILMVFLQRLQTP